MSDLMTKMPKEATELAEPNDAYGAGFVEYQARTSFRDMCRIYGFESARAIMAEIILSEANRKRITIDG